MHSKEEKDMVVRSIMILRERRVRPSVDKIAWFLRRENLARHKVESILDELMENEEVLRVVYKGATSFRIAKTWCKAKDVIKHPTRTKVRVMNSTSTSRVVRDAIAEFGPNGTTKENLQKHLEAAGHVRLAEKLDLILYRGVRSGSLLRVDTTSGSKTQISFMNADASATKDQEILPIEQEDNKEEAKSPLSMSTDASRKRGRPKARALPEPVVLRGRGRPPSSRNKKTKKVFDPSEEANQHKSYPSRCDICSLPHQSRNPSEEMLFCSMCPARVHPTCMGYSAELALKSRMSPWTCMDCKHCSVCDMDHTVGTLIFCDECDRAFHLTCHQPSLSEPIPESWVCCVCVAKTKQIVVIGCDGLSGLLTPRDSPVQDEESHTSSGLSDHSSYDQDIPSAVHWTVDNVIDYFNEKGFQEISYVFKQQDIDGTALLLLKRSDVLSGLNLKLGPALKIYKHIRILQTRLPNPPLT